MGVLTREEYEKQKRLEPVFKNTEPVAVEAQAASEPKCEYHLLYPENPKSGNYNGPWRILDTDLEIVNGKIITDNYTISEALRNQGFYLIKMEHK